MNILYLNSEKSWRGGEQQLSYLITGMSSKKAHKLYVMGKKGSPLEQWCSENKIEFIPARFRGSTDLITAYKISKICRKLEIDIMHAQTSHAHASALYSKFFFNKAHIILHRRVSFPVKNNAISHFKYCSKSIKKIICVSRDVQRVLTSSTKQPEKTVIITDAVHPKRFLNNNLYEASFRERYDLPRSQYIVANTAALSSEKDYITFINTAEAALEKDLDAIFLIVGRGSEKDAIADLIKDKKLTERIFMLGFVEDISDILQHIDLLLVTSKKEGLGSSILDAFYMRRPVVATAAGGIPELVIHEQTGLLADIGNHQELAQHVHTVLKHEDAAAAYVENAYSLVTTQFLVEHMVEQTEKIYKQVQAS